MAYLPSRTKYRKVHTGRIYGTAQSCNTLAFGEFGIQSLTRGRMTSQQIEAARVAMTRSLKRKGKVWIRVFPHKPVTKKPAETRMGKGKGSVEKWVAVIRPGDRAQPLVARGASRVILTHLRQKCRSEPTRRQ